MPRGSRRLHAHLFALLGRGVHAAGRRSFSRARQGEGGAAHGRPRDRREPPPAGAGLPAETGSARRPLLTDPGEAG